MKQIQNNSIKLKFCVKRSSQTKTMSAITTYLTTITSYIDTVKLSATYLVVVSIYSNLVKHEFFCWMRWII